MGGNPGKEFTKAYLSSQLNGLTNKTFIKWIIYQGKRIPVTVRLYRMNLNQNLDLIVR